MEKKGLFATNKRKEKLGCGEIRRNGNWKGFNGKVREHSQPRHLMRLVFFIWLKRKNREERSEEENAEKEKESEIEW